MKYTDMQIIKKNVNELVPYENNPRHNDDAVEYVANSIEQFGFKVPIIIDKDNVIVAGHTRLKAAKKLGMEYVPCILADDLSDEQVRAFRLADNKVGELAGWDNDKLEQELAGIFDIDMALFDFSLDDFSFDEDIIQPEEKELRPYRKVHYLISADINLNDKILEIISKLKEVEGIEIKSTSN